jgi:hypothetical protein
MASDLASQPHNGLIVQLCDDAVGDVWLRRDPSDGYGSVAGS